jgi:two-component sensor histidine kinase
MRYAVTTIFLLATFFLKAQENYSGDRLPVFKQVTHPFMPPITSEYFFFSEDGLVWFSTAQGLTSFDGSDIMYHSTLQQANSFGLVRILAIAEDSNHNFYIGTPTGFYYYNRRIRLYTEFTYTFPDTHKQFSPGIYALYMDKNGFIYGGTGNGGMFIYEPRKNQLLHYNIDASKPDSWQDRKLNSVVSFAAHATDSNKLWVGTFNGIYLFDKVKKIFSWNFEFTHPRTHKYVPGSDTVRHATDVQKMDVANDSIIWFNSWAGGFAKYNSQTGKATVVFGLDALYKAKDLYYGYVIRKFVKLSDGKYLLGINNGKTAIFDTRKNTVVYFSVTGVNYPEEETRYVTNDRHGNTWLLQRGFLYVSIPEKLRLQSVIVPNVTAFNFNTPKMRGIYFDSSSRLFYGTFLSSAGIHVYDTNFIQQTILPTSVINNFYNYGSTVDNKITKDGSGRFWTTGWENHVKLPGPKKFELIEKQFPSLAWLGEKNKFVDIATTRNGDILFKNNDGVIFHVNHITLTVDTIRCPGIKEAGFEIKNASAWYDNKRDMVYLTSKKGIAQFNLAKQEMRVIPHLSLFGGLKPWQAVCAPALDAEGRLWFMIQLYGIRIIDPVSLNCIDSIQYGTKGLMRGDFTAIIGGSAQYILFRSLNGIVVYDYRKKQSFLFDHSNGLSSPDNKAFLYSNGYVIISHSGRFEYCKLSDLDNYSSTVTPYLNAIVADTTAVFTRTGPDNELHLKLSHHQNTLTFSFSAPEFFFPERIEYAYQLVPIDKDWHYTNYFNHKTIYTKLAPGNYKFLLKSQIQGGNWDAKPVEYIIIIEPAWWQTNWFKLLCLLLGALLIMYLIGKRIQYIRKTEQQKARHEKELLELESKALRAQMNPHFIFNCLNSIKSLIQQNENEKSVTYLTTFSKLIRTLFNNADKKEISLYDEIETCKLYMQLEAMRFDTKFSFTVQVDENIDLKSIQVPALIIQPFIENAIWHGIVPRNKGGRVSLSVVKKNGLAEIIIDDDGIGRESSHQNKPASAIAHQSKGVNLTQSRLELNNLLQQRQAKFEIIDKKDGSGTATGTTVIIKVKEELL